MSNFEAWWERHGGFFKEACKEAYNAGYSDAKCIELNGPIAREAVKRSQEYIDNRGKTKVCTNCLKGKYK
jgi:hypothetical protein